MWMKSVIEWDEKSSKKLRIADDRHFLKWIAAVLAHSGDSWFWIVGLIIVWVRGEQEWKERVVIYLAAILSLAVFVMILKFTIRRRRPEGEWGAIYRQTDPHSFPSGHAARAALLAFLGVAFGPSWWGILLALWAPCVSLARVAMGVHYLSDVLAGLLMGLAGGVVTAFLVR
jgi:undecaprenyl-diphosphatase